MNKSFVFSSIRRILIFLFILFCLLLPASDLFISKKMIFFLSMVFFVVNCFVSFDSLYLNKNTLLKVFIVLTLIIFFSITTISEPDTGALFLIVSCLTLFITLPTHKMGKEFFLYFIINTNILSFVVVVMAIASNVNPAVSSNLKTLFLKHGCGFLGERRWGPIVCPMIFFRTSPVLLISSSFYYYKLIKHPKIKYFSLLVLQGIAILMSASRGLYLFTYLSFLVISLQQWKYSRFRLFFLILLFIGIQGCVFLFSSTNMFDVSETSNSIKINHIKSFIDLVDRNPSVLLWGNGTGSVYYTSGFNGYYFQTEVTFIDMIRYFGVPVTLLLLFIIIVPMRFKNPMNIPFIMYFLDATTNPLIFCSTGMLVISVYFVMQEKSFCEIEKYKKVGLWHCKYNSILS